MDSEQEESWLTLGEAGQKLGLSKDALRKRVTRGKLDARKGNDGTLRVLVTSAMLTGQDGDSSTTVHDRGEVGRLLVQLDEARERGEAAASEAAEARLALARIEERLAASERRESDLRAERDRLAAELAEARKPWLVRLVEALRRR
jgi:hypothetical protein